MVYSSRGLSCKCSCWPPILVVLRSIPKANKRSLSSLTSLSVCVSRGEPCCGIFLFFPFLFPQIPRVSIRGILHKKRNSTRNRCSTKEHVQSAIAVVRSKLSKNDYQESALKRPKPKKNKSPRSLVKSKMCFSIPFVSQDSTDTFVVFATKPQKRPLSLVESPPIRLSAISLGGLLHCVPFVSDKFNHGVQRPLDKHKIARLCNTRGRTILKTTARSPSWPAKRVISLGIRTVPVLSVAKKLAGSDRTGREVRADQAG